MKPTLTIDPTGRVVGANRQATQALGAVLGRSCHEVFRARDGDDRAWCSRSCGVEVMRHGNEGRELVGGLVRGESGNLSCARVGPVGVITLERPPGAEPCPLTPREREVIGQFSLGKTTPAVAEALGVAPSTVRTHLEHAREKLGARTVAEAVARALANRWLAE